MFSYESTVRKDRRTKNLVKRLKTTDIALISHIDVDRVTAESLVKSKVRAVINTEKFISGKYPNKGPLLMCQKGIHLVEETGMELFEELNEGDLIRLEGGKIFRNGEPAGEGRILDHDKIIERLKAAEKAVGDELERFAINTLSYIQEERECLFGEIEAPELSLSLEGRHVMVVVRGHDYKEDLKVLQPYIRDVKPVLVAVDGGADALLEFKLKPHIIIGDMDSVSDEALMLDGVEKVVHAYPDGTAPGLTRLRKLGLSGKTFSYPGTSEDIAILLAFENRAELIVAVGTHFNLVEFLDKGRKGMASTFLVRLKAGEKIVDAKGVSKLYPEKVKLSHLLLLVFATLLTFSTIALTSPWVREFVNIYVIKLRLLIGV